MHPRLPLLATVVGCWIVSACDSGPAGPGGPSHLEVPTSCEPPHTSSLAVGETVTLSGPSARFFCIEADSVDSDYILVALSGSVDATSLTFRSERTANFQGAQSPTGRAAGHDGPESLPRGSPISGLVSGPELDDAAHMEWRAAVKRDLAELVGTGGDTPAFPPARSIGTPTPAPPVGSLMNLNVQSEPGLACTNPRHVDSRVEVVSERAIVASDVTNPPGGFTREQYAYFADVFDNIISPLIEENFGSVTDIDGNGRTILLFTQEVNRRTPAGATTFVSGFFHARDLIPRGGGLSAPRPTGSCAHSNEAEILYLMVPDPEGTVNGNRRSRFAVQEVTLATIIHEKQHLVNAGRRLYQTQLTGSQWEEEGWLNEGLSHTAEELLFYRMSGLGPRQNISDRTLINAGFGGGLVNFQQHQRSNFLRFHEYLEDPENHSLYDGIGSTLVPTPTRGAAWSFLRYTADRRGGNPAAFYRALLNSSTHGTTNLATVLGGNDIMLSWLSDWAVANYADERVPNLSDRHRHLSWNLPSIFASIHRFDRRYPIRVDELIERSPETRGIVAGGVVYLRFGVESEEIAQLEVTQVGGFPQETLRVVVLRTR